MISVVNWSDQIQGSSVGTRNFLSDPVEGSDLVLLDEVRLRNQRDLCVEVWREAPVKNGGYRGALGVGPRAPRARPGVVPFSSSEMAQRRGSGGGGEAIGVSRRCRGRTS